MVDKCAGVTLVTVKTDGACILGMIPRFASSSEKYACIFLKYNQKASSFRMVCLHLGKKLAISKQKLRSMLANF